ncbi:radical SAM family heme chaperone HemW [Nitrospira sp. Kam-Ns4a]
MQTSSLGRVGLYLHVPFCTTRCLFCAFSLQIYREDWATAYLASLAREIELHARRGSLGGRLLDTVYFGGGTPTTLTPEALTSILDRVRDRLGVAPDAEVTIEAHPDTVTADGLRRLVRAGFTRISFGAQSMDANELSRVGRRTGPDRTRAAVAGAKAAGFGNVNLDLIYGLPGQTLESWLATLDEALALEPTHLSLYALTVEDRTGLQVAVHRSTVSEPDLDLQNAMEAVAAQRLAAAGFSRYEISNYCRPGFACRHNLLYWQDEDYLGLGPSAQSYLEGCRLGNLEGLTAWRRALDRGELPIAESARLSPAQRRREALIFGLRLTEGVPLDRLKRNGPEDGLADVLDRLARQGLIEGRAGRVALTEQGQRLADSVAVELL